MWYGRRGGVVWRGVVRRGMAGTLRWGGASYGEARLVLVWQVRFGWLGRGWLGMAWQGMAWQAGHGRLGEVWQVRVRRGQAGMAR